METGNSTGNPGNEVFAIWQRFLNVFCDTRKLKDDFRKLLA